MRHALLLLALLAPAVASAQATADDEVQRARSKTCAAFLTELSNHVATGQPAGTTPSFAAAWGALLRADQAAGGPAAGHLAHASLMLDNTKLACARVRAKTLGAVMDAEFALLPDPKAASRSVP